MTAEARVYGNVGFDFLPAESNMAPQDPYYDEIQDAGYVPDGGTAQVNILDPQTARYRGTVLILDFGDRIDILIGGTPRVRHFEGRPTKIELRGKRQRITIRNEARRVYAHGGILDITHPAPGDPFARRG